MANERVIAGPVRTNTGIFRQSYIDYMEMPECI